jgi:phosphopantothenoylcysteine synthetase/decarboxylase
VTAPRHLLVVVCGAGPAGNVGQLVSLAHTDLWTVQAAATPSALAFIDIDEVGKLTGFPVRSNFQPPTAQGRREIPDVDALIVAPATYNTVNKLAAGVADTYALTSIAELIGRRVPTVIVPFVNSALAGRAPFGRSVAALRGEGVRVLLGAEDGWMPHPPGTGSDRQLAFPWEAAFLAVREQVGS